MASVAELPRTTSVLPNPFIQKQHNADLSLVKFPALSVLRSFYNIKTSRYSGIGQ